MLLSQQEKQNSNDRPKTKNHAISVQTRHLEKIPIQDENSQKNGKRENFPSLVKSIHRKPTAHVILEGEEWNVFTLRPRKGQNVHRSRDWGGTQNRPARATPDTQLRAGWEQTRSHPKISHPVQKLKVHHGLKYETNS